ncbi:hypothetical protein XENOCAPTIV_000372 [Xenoophorus captivus]|uniref:Leucine zipper tumor suppressor 2 homolog n=1 Tax=Xenoophorus captivus TaxID=1517983 RepID=A0ABV0QM06_9TELE
MALVQALPISAEPHTPSHIGGARRRHQSGPSPPINLPPPTLDPMGSVSSLVTTRPNPYQDHRSVVELGGRVRRPTPGSSCLGCESPRDPLLQNIPPPKKQSSTSIRGLEKESGNGNYTYINEDYVGDWNDNHVRPPSLESELEEAKEGLGINGNVGGPPPRLIPVSGKLEKNMEKTVLRPTAFKPVIPKSRSAMHYLSPRHGANVPESQKNLNLPSPAHREVSPSCSEKRSSYSGGRNASSGSSQSCSLSDSGRNSLCSLPAYNGATYSLASAEVPAGHLEPIKSVPSIGAHGHSNSDSGRSSSSKSSGSMSGRGQPLSDSGSGGRSPGPVEGYEGVVRDLEDKLRERELELQQLKDNLDDNEAAICQVCQKSGEISLLKQQLKEVQSELAQRVGEIVSLRGQLRETRGELTNTQVLLQEAHGTTRTRTMELEVCENELQRRKSEAELLREKVGRLDGELAHLRDTLANQGAGHRQCQVFQEAEEHLLAYESDEAKAQRQSSAETLQSMKVQMEGLKSELAFERKRVEQQAGGFEEERRIWQEEKDKVIRYQKQLQENYVQMYRRNKELEQLLQELTLELESREDDEGSGNEINFDEIAATEI